MTHVDSASSPAAVDCAVLVVTYNSADHVGNLIASLPEAADGLQIRVVVVDNGSSDATADIVRTFPDVVYLPTGANLGYAGGINAGRDACRPCSSVLIVNPDLTLEPGSLRRLHLALDRPGVGIAVPTLLNPDGSYYPSLRREPTVLRAMGDALFGGRWRGRPGWFTETVWRVPAGERDVDWAGGAVLLVSSECDEVVGSWDDQRFFLYSEETDYAARARDAGFRIVYVPTARARHIGGASGGSPQLVALMTVNRVRYYEKRHGRRAAAWAFRAGVMLHGLVRFMQPAQRVALYAVMRRSRWSGLPGGRPPSM